GAPQWLELEQISAKIKTGDTLCGTADKATRELHFLLNGNVDTAKTLKPREDGRWCITLPGISLDSRDYTAQVYDPHGNAATSELLFDGQSGAAITAQFLDPAGDDRGPDGEYEVLTDAPDHRASDLLSVEIRANDEQLELVIEVAEISNVWNYTNGFDHTAFNIFFDTHPDGGANVLPGLNTEMPDGFAWDHSHRLYGMGSSFHSALGADADKAGELASGKPEIRVNYESSTFTILYNRSELGIESWLSAAIYIATWDADEFGRLRPLGETASAGQLGGGDAASPLILDDMVITLGERGAP
ncbi:MAG: glucodextranase DOMON-like domain-containing protein, partial [Pseudomonadota bacterium]